MIDPSDGILAGFYDIFFFFFFFPKLLPPLKRDDRNTEI